MEELSSQEFSSTETWVSAECFEKLLDRVIDICIEINQFSLFKSQKAQSQRSSDSKQWRAVKKTRCFKLLKAMQLCLSMSTNSVSSRRDKALTGKHSFSLSLKPSKN